jgi:heme/copper-type cytochrome/quinol oxidase subunit 3
MALVLIAGLAYFWGQWFGLYRQKLSNLTIGLWIAAVLTVISVVIHIIELHKPGFSLQSGGYVSLFITIEGVFTFVLAATALVLIGFAIRASRGLFTGGAGAGVEAFGEWYGWISAIALFNFLALYVQPFFPIA